MVFSSITFLCGFLPIVFLLYYLIPQKTFRNALLIIASLLFYAYGEPVYILLMLGSIAGNYLFGLMMAGSSKTRRKFALWLAVVFNIGLLVIFKYAGMLVEWTNALFHVSLPAVEIALPVGISFFTFQALSYVIDVYRKEVDVQHNLFYVMLYISFFPQLIAGPIVKYHDIETEIENRTVSWDLCAKGFRRFVCGLAKKVMIANTIAFVVDGLYALPAGSQNVLTSWVFALGYLFQIYFDFSGYSDMAIGLGWMFGFHFRENFNYPYISSSIQEFWRRWHISLSTWFKEYLYIPLGGNRKGKVRTSINKLIVFVCTGIWHGASLTFLFWGLWHGFFILLEQWVDFSRIPKALRWVGTLLVVIFGFVIFRADSLAQGFGLWRSMIAGWSFDPASLSALSVLMTPVVMIAFIFAFVLSAPVRLWLEEHTGKWSAPLGYTGSVLLLGCVMLMLAGGGYNPFIYFRF